ncbi:hypothetical protein AB1K62_05290 [Parasphingorhabdus sp. JC815]|uniref:hypothetical protein n=1 Tax=Parasphingorhabdus sp. JC815 TaxID=3232140 RepID=UPI003459FDF9
MITTIALVMTMPVINPVHSFDIIASHPYDPDKEAANAGSTQAILMLRYVNSVGGAKNA